MNLYFNLGNLHIPTYGLCITLGIISANIIAVSILKKSKLNENDFIILEAYTFLGAFLGAKGLFLLVSYESIEWYRILEFTYFNQLMRGGFVFYGGLIVGIIFILLAGKLHKIETMLYIDNLIFVIPWVHGFGRIGCFMAGCCYGIPYNGFGAVEYTARTLAPQGVSLFPVQLVEAVALLIMSVVIFILRIKKNWNYTLEIYLISYAILRFCLEYVRGDIVRGKALLLSTSQWLSVGVIIFTIFLLCWKKKCKKAW